MEIITKFNNQKGITLIEVLISTFIFSILAIEISMIFIQVLNLERRDFAIQKIEENALFVLEEMARNIRVSDILNQESPKCTANTLTMTHPIKGAVVYQLNNGVVEKSEGGGVFNPISTSKVNFIKLNFCIKGSGINDNLTPRITILTSIRNLIGPIQNNINSPQTSTNNALGVEGNYQVDVQTTVSSRNLANELQFP